MQPISRRSIVDKIVATHKQYTKIQKKPRNRGAPEFEDSHISFLSKKQPRLATIEQDLEWYWKVAETGEGSLGSVDMNAH